MSQNKKSPLTPLMQQYREIKDQHRDQILLFRMGDFYEMFEGDAEKAAPILGIALTSRNKKSQDDTPMCGVPAHSVAGPINKLLAHGFKVALCEQIEDPRLAKGLVQRAVTRVLTPGVVYDSETIPETLAHYLACWDENFVSFLDVTTGEAFYYSFENQETLERVLNLLRPVEVVKLQSVSKKQTLQIPSVRAWTKWPNDKSNNQRSGQLNNQPSNQYKQSQQQSTMPPSAQHLLAYVQSLGAGGSSGAGAGAGAGAGVVQNLLIEFKQRELQDRLELSSSVLRHLEVFETYRGEVDGSLFQAIDRLKTSAGRRCLRRWLQFPLLDESELNNRLDAVEYWASATKRLQNIRSILARLGDVERRLHRVASPQVQARDLLLLSSDLEAGSQLIAEFETQKKKAKSSKLSSSHQDSEYANSELSIKIINELAAKIRSTLVEEPPLVLKNGGMIRAGVSPELDEWIDLSLHSRQKLMELEAREKSLTGISSLKVRYNNIFGYYIEVTNTHKDKVPLERYRRKQTLSTSERFVTKELEELEQKILLSQTKRVEVELEIFACLKEEALKRAPRILYWAQRWTELDVITSLAFLAMEQSYVRPQWSRDRSLRLKGSRHPVVEQRLKTPFVANDIELAPQSTLLLTGPNMAGKSTLMRQVAISAILAQIGSFVPAADARLPLFDQVFTRIGASDDLAAGLSTFMVEMKETAEMLQSATPRSLVILDEVGRGTSTYDGLSLAQAILEYLLENSRPLTLFATHYHELTHLASRYALLRNSHMEIFEKSGRISFLYRLTPGPAEKSYGIAVARLAGLPSSVTRRASVILKNLERDDNPSIQPSLFAFSEAFECEGRAEKCMAAGVGVSESQSECSEQTNIKVSELITAIEKAKALMDEINQCNIDQTAPIDALLKLRDLRFKSSEWLGNLIN